MAATDQPYRSQRALDIVFAVSCILMLVSVVWMFVQDYARDWKGDQRQFRDVETAVNERLMLERLPDPGVVATKRQAAEAARKEFNDAKAAVDREDLVAVAHDRRHRQVGLEPLPDRDRPAARTAAHTGTATDAGAAPAADTEQRNRP